jgi:hypothetical protein
MSCKVLIVSAVVVLMLVPEPAAVGQTRPEERLLEIVTVPALDGIRFTLDGTGFSSGTDGVARIRVAIPGPHILVAPVVQRPDRGVRARLVGWQDGSRSPRRRLDFSARRTRLRAGFVVSEHTTFIFVDPRGSRLSAKRISAVELASSDRSRIFIRGGRPRWLRSSAAVSRMGRLRQIRIHYAVERVLAGGSNVVNRGQQRFSPGGQVRIDVLFFSLRIKVRDAFFGFPLGSKIQIEYPDHHQARHRLQGGQVALGPLPRGDYIVKVNAAGIGNHHAVVISRNAAISIKILSYYDGLTVLFVFGVLSVGLFMLGRGRHRGRSKQSMAVVAGKEAERH